MAFDQKGSKFAHIETSQEGKKRSRLTLISNPCYGNPKRVSASDVENFPFWCIAGGGLAPLHLNEINCLEVVVIRGDGEKVHEVAGKLIATKGVENGQDNIPAGFTFIYGFLKTLREF